MTKRETIKRQRLLESDGWALKSEDINAICPHAGKVTPLHFHVKCELARTVANQKGNSFYTEAPLGDVSVDADKADILLFRESTHEKAIVVELESDVTQEKKREKVNTYFTDNIQDVLVLDPQKAPTDITDLGKWLTNELNGFL